MTRRSRPPLAQDRAARRTTGRPGGRSQPPSTRTLPLRLAAFTGIALVIGAAAIGLVVSRLQGPAASDTTAVQVHASRGGFEPPALTVKAGQTVKV